MGLFVFKNIRLLNDLKFKYFIDFVVLIGLRLIDLLKFRTLDKK